MYRGEYAADKFVRHLQKDARQLCDEYIAEPKTMIFSTEDSLSFTNATTCHICTKPLTDDDRVRDHCHITGIYRGAVHSSCNLNYRITPKSWKLPVVIHNLKGYDGNLIVKALKSEFGSVGMIPQNLEKDLSLTIRQLKFLDSYQFTPKSLNVLSKTLEDDEFKYLVESCTTSHFDLVRRKGVYPYDYMDSVEWFDEAELPSQDAFFNKLSGSSCSYIDYAHASRVWDAFGCETIADYHDVYLQLDVLLLVDFFEKFRRTCLDFYSLDPLNYYPTPGLAWDAALRMSRVELELNTDENIYNLNENSVRGGMSMISTRYARADNPSFPSTYDDKLPRQDLIYLDANNLYGYAMSQFLPTHGFRLLSSDEITALELELDSEDGYIYEVDLHYPAKLHNRHDDYPLAPESLVIDREMYSPTQQSVQSIPEKKLTPNLRDKTRYVVHYRNLKLYVQLGLAITKVHRVLTFKQSPWLKAYIDFNTHHRSLSDNGFLRDFFILMNNSVSGKTQENLRKRVQVDLITDAAVLRKRVAKPSFCRGIPITDCLQASFSTKQSGDGNGVSLRYRTRLIRSIDLENPVRMR